MADTRALDITIRVRDEATAQLARLEQSLAAFGRSVASTSQRAQAAVATVGPGARQLAGGMGPTPQAMQSAVQAARQAGQAQTQAAKLAADAQIAAANRASREQIAAANRAAQGQRQAAHLAAQGQAQQANLAAQAQTQAANRASREQIAAANRAAQGQRQAARLAAQDASRMAPRGIVEGLATGGLVGGFQAVNTAAAGLVRALGPVGLTVAGTIVVLGALAVQAAQMATPIINLQNRFQAVTGSFSQGQRAFQETSRLANRLGLDVTTLGTQYASFMAASRGTNLEGDKTRQVFESIAAASVRLGLSNEQVGRAFTALQQIVSKGTLSAEELRGQLGEAIPGAVQIMARAFGVGTAELQKMMQQGLIPGAEAVAKFAQQITREGGPAVERLGIGMARLRNTVTELATVVGGPLARAWDTAANALATYLQRQLNVGAAVEEGLKRVQERTGIALKDLQELDYQTQRYLTRQGMVYDAADQRRLAQEALRMQREASTEELLFGAGVTLTQPAEIARSTQQAVEGSRLAYERARATQETYLQSVARTTDEEGKLAERLRGLTKVRGELREQLAALTPAQAALRTEMERQLTVTEREITTVEKRQEALRQESQEAKEQEREREQAAKKRLADVKQEAQARETLKQTILDAYQIAQLATEDERKAEELRRTATRLKFDPADVEDLVYIAALTDRDTAANQRREAAIQQANEAYHALYTQLNQDLETYQLARDENLTREQAEEALQIARLQRTPEETDALMRKAATFRTMTREYEKQQAILTQMQTIDDDLTEGAARLAYARAQILTTSEAELELAVRRLAISTEEQDALITKLRLLREQNEQYDRQNEKVEETRELIRQTLTTLDITQTPIVPRARSVREEQQQMIEEMRRRGAPAADIALAEQFAAGRLQAIALNDVLEGMRDTADLLGDSLEEGLLAIMEGAATSAESLGETLQNMGKGLIKLFGKEIIQLGLMPLRQSLRDLASELAKSDLMKAIVGWTTKALGLGLGAVGAAPIPGMALTGGGGSFMPPVSVGVHGGIFGTIPGAQMGGLFASPRVRLLGEATPEAAVPLTEEGIARFTRGLQRGRGSPEGRGTGDPGWGSRAGLPALNRQWKEAIDQLAKRPIVLEVTIAAPVDMSKMRTTPEEIIQVVGRDIAQDGVTRRIIQQHTKR